MKENRIKWHTYPEERPDENKLYLVTLEDSYGEKIVVVRYCWNGNFAPFAPVIAWAELPDAYEEE